jgi:hypothetical protein
MKKTILCFTLCAIIATGCNFGNNADNISITVKKTDPNYKFTAEYPARKTAEVIKYINKSLDKDKLLSNPYDSKDVNINLGDTVRFHLISEPGYLEIYFKKMDNSRLSYRKLEEMCVGIKEVLR